MAAVFYQGKNRRNKSEILSKANQRCGGSGKENREFASVHKNQAAGGASTAKKSRNGYGGYYPRAHHQSPIDDSYIDGETMIEQQYRGSQDGLSALNLLQCL